jgi:hypothetical protein
LLCADSTKPTPQFNRASGMILNAHIPEGLLTLCLYRMLRLASEPLLTHTQPGNGWKVLFYTYG